MNVTNLTSEAIYFGPLHIDPNAINVYIDDTSATSLYLTNDSVAEALNNAYNAGKIQVTSQAQPFPRPTGTPELLHGTGWPEGLVFAPQGSIFMRRDNSGANNSLYAKTTGETISTGWQAFAEAAPALPATSLPGSPGDGQQTVLVDSPSAPTYAWLLQYNAAAGKWYFLGGLPIEIKTGSINSSSGSYIALSNTVTVPRSGLYAITLQGIRTGSNSTVYFRFKYGSNDSANSAGVATNGGVSWVERVTCNASDVIQAYARSDSGYTAQGYAFLSIQPLSVT